ncbi:hypothetical protein BCR42DRAFT_406414 [Absidia repens]|uniref:Bromo domain-containing protein n=1 Tax=Absidia repens TaxID=90262 RepID=A0A1X2IUT5_9FUNG|nr:hypothetical protein BCR42DRAFT_406414 [Absidia repens]
MATVTMEWTILERLILAQAVNKYGDDDWIQVARTLKQHPLLQSSARPEAFNQKNCSLQYYLMLENMETERRQPKTSNAIIAQDMPNVVKLARQLYFQRVEELNKSIKEDEDQFMTTLSEIDDIKSGAWDSKLPYETDGQLPSTSLKLDNATDVTMDQHTLGTLGRSSIPDTNMNKEADSDTLQHEDGIIQHKDKSVTIPSFDTSNNGVNGHSSEPSTSQYQQQQKQHDDISTTNSGTIDMPIGLKRCSDDNQSSAEHLDQQHIIQPSSKRLKFGDNRFTTDITGKDNDEEEYEDEESPRYDLPIPTEAKLPHSLSNPSNHHSSSTSMSLTSSPSPSSTSTSTASASSSASASASASASSSASSSPHIKPAASEKRYSDDAQRQKSWQKNVNLLWREIANHKNGAIFMNPIKETQAPLYYQAVKYPMDLKMIKNRIREGVIQTTVEFERDIILMLTNSLMYNKEGTEMYQMALEMLQDVTEQIRIFKTADDNRSTHTRSGSTLAKHGRRSLAE